MVGVQRTALTDSIDAREVRVVASAAGHGVVIVEAPRIRSDPDATLVESDACTATHGRHEFVERDPTTTRAGLAVAGALLALA